MLQKYRSWLFIVIVLHILLVIGKSAGQGDGKAQQETQGQRQGGGGGNSDDEDGGFTNEDDGFHSFIKKPEKRDLYPKSRFSLKIKVIERLTKKKALNPKKTLKIAEKIFMWGLESSLILTIES